LSRPAGEGRNRTRQPGSDLEDLVGAVNERAREVLEEAEQSAASIVGEAEAAAARRIEDARRADDLVTERIRRLSELADELLELAAAARRQSDELIGDLERTVRKVFLDPDPGGAAGVAQPAPGLEHARRPAGRAPSLPPHLLMAEVDAAHARSDDELESDPGVVFREGAGIASERARLLATQMAVAGSSREEIEGRLRAEFGIRDAAAILNGVADSEQRS
jgi:hypothetical protein